MNIANDSVIEVGEHGILEIGSECHINGGFRLSCQRNIILGQDLLASWDVSIFDTDFHRMKNCINKEKIESCTKAVIIGNNCWLGFGSTIMKGTQLGNGCTVGAKSVIAKDFSSSSNTIFIGNPAKPIKQGYRLDIYDCKPEYESE